MLIERRLIESVDQSIGFNGGGGHLMTQAKLIGGKNDIREIKSRLVEAGCFRSARVTYAIRVSAVVLGVLLAACSSATVSEKPQSPKEPTIEETATPSAEPVKISSGPIRIAPQLINGWPADTPDLRDVIFNIELIGNRERVLSDDASGFLLIQSEVTSEAAKLVFYNGKRALYRLPAHGFRVHSIGSDFICREASFVIPNDERKEIELDVRITVGEGFHVDGGASFKLTSPLGTSASCYISSAWVRIDAAKDEAASSGGKGAEGGGKGVTAKEVALVVAKGVVITAAVALCVGSGFVLCF
jgi:hypothetical protein